MTSSGTPPGRGVQDQASAIKGEDLRAQYAAAVQMAVYDGQLSWQVTGLFVQFAILLVAGAVSPSFAGTSNKLLLALVGAIVAVAGIIMSAMFGSMALRIRTYQDYWSARAEELEAMMPLHGLFTGASQLSRTGTLTVGSITLRMRRSYGVKTKVMMTLLFGVLTLAFVGLLVFNLVRAF
jgi:hypothetical protein